MKIGVKIMQGKFEKKNGIPTGKVGERTANTFWLGGLGKWHESEGEYPKGEGRGGKTIPGGGKKTPEVHKSRNLGSPGVDLQIGNQGGWGLFWVGVLGEEGTGEG